MPLSNPRSDLRAPRLRVIANGQVIAGAMEAEVVSNNYYAADRFSASVALGIDQWAEASFWASEPDILLDVQFSLDGGASFTSLVQGAVDRVSSRSHVSTGLSRRPRPHRLADRGPHAGDVRQPHVERDRLGSGGSPQPDTARVCHHDSGGPVLSKRA